MATSALPMLSSLLNHENINKNNDNLETIKFALEKRGWCVVENDVFNPSQVEAFFKYQETCALGWNDFMRDHHRDKNFPVNRFGYFETDRKIGYRFMTGSYITLRNQHYLGAHEKLVRQMDTFCANAFKATGHYLFSIANDEPLYHIPLLGGCSTQPMNPSDPKNSNNAGAYGLFDTVTYLPQSKWKNSEKYKDTVFQVDEHVDPGLFSISMGATQDGLELYDPTTNTWCKPPKASDFVIWCGTEANTISKGKITAGKHRVQKPDENQTNCRTTAWFEVSVEGQVPLEDIGNMKKTISQLSREMELSLAEFKTGIPMSKSGVEIRRGVRLPSSAQNNDSSWCNVM